MRGFPKGRVAGLSLLVCLLASQSVLAAIGTLEAQTALERAGAFFRDRLGVGSTYVWKYSVDGTTRRGEGGRIAHSIGWVQPPGTPAVGAAFLRIHEITNRPEWLDAARGVADALVRTQLLSGGWHYRIETDPRKALDWCYRSRGISPKECRNIGSNPDRNKTVLDDNTTQSALNFLMWFDQASGQSDPGVGEAVNIGLRRLMNAQYGNGGFTPFFTDDIPGHDVPTATRASIPQTWSRVWVKPDTPPYFVINDNLPRDVGRLFLNAYRLYGDERYLRTAVRVGDFLLATQLPAPQTGWAQTYDRSLHPVWGRKFEPPGVVSRETAGSIDYLIELYGQTQREDYLDAAGAAAEWLETVRLPNGHWARYYELTTNRPLFVDNENRITFENDDPIDHYGIEGTFDIPQVLARFHRVKAGRELPRPANLWVSEVDALDPADVEKEAARFVDELDPEGRWVDDRWIEGQRFMRGVFVLARFIAEVGTPVR